MVKLGLVLVDFVLQFLGASGGHVERWGVKWGVGPLKKGGYVIYITTIMAIREIQ
jgi:hypothetical protein